VFFNPIVATGTIVDALNNHFSLSEKSSQEYITFSEYDKMKLKLVCA
jgi:hypothetical protein